MSKQMVELHIQQLTLCKQETLRVAGGVAEADRFRQLREGKVHPAWLVGHMANTMDSIVLGWTLLQESTLSKGFRKQFAPDFAGGLPVTGNPEDYPAWDEVLGHYEEVLNKAAAGLASLDDASLAGPLKGNIPDTLRTRFSSVGHTLTFLVLHDSYHRGQIGMLSKLNS